MNVDISQNSGSYSPATHKLIITEKPSVGSAIAKVLGARSRQEGYIEGNGYIISWCLGHLVQLADAKDYDPRYERWTIEDLPILPEKWQYQVIPEKRGQFDIVKELMLDQRVGRIICATDAGREGELIFRLVYQMAGCDKPFDRLWISSMEDNAIREGFAQLKAGAAYDGLYDSANCRARADWAVGINATRLFTCLYRTPLSIGRVQTPTLAMLVEREQRIAAFQAEKSYSVRLDLGDFAADSENMPLTEAEALKSTCEGRECCVLAVEEKERSTGAPKLYDLTTLQRDANRLHGLTAQETLDTAQRLYEKKLITYPRTDSQFITQDMETGTLALVKLLLETLPWAKGVSIAPDLSKSVNDAKVGDHHALLPTRQLARADWTALGEEEKKLVELICQRLILAASPKYLYRSVAASMDCGGVAFAATGKTTLQEGWKGVQRQIKAGEVDEEDEGSQADSGLPPLEAGQCFSVVGSAIQEHETTPPRHFTEDTLLSAMETAGNDELDKSLDTEKRGLGTPATRAGIIEKLIKGGLALRNKKQILPTEKGIKLISIAPELMKSPKLTAQWENQLTEIAGGSRDADAFMEGIWNLVGQVMGEKNGIHDRRRFAAPRQDDREVIGACPRCGANVYETKSNFRCSGQDCGFALWKDAHFFTGKKKELKKMAAKSLLKTGRAKMRGFVSERTGKKFDATVVMEDTGGKYVKYRLEFEDKK